MNEYEKENNGEMDENGAYPHDDKTRLVREIAEREEAMNSPTFWEDKERAQKVIQEYQDLKDELEGVGRYDKGSALLTLFAGAGGDDAEDFVRLLYTMYTSFCSSRGFSITLLHEHESEHGGFRNITMEVAGAHAYGTLKNESGVHRLVRISPFNANKKRHTSFAMVEVVPKLAEVKDVDIPEEELVIDFAKSGGAGGQNVNKRETAVRIVHLPTNLSVHISSERSQAQNREKALALLRGKLYHKREQDRKKHEQGLAISTTVQNEWGSQIRSYVLHPYKLVKDHRTGVEVRDVDKVLAGDIDEFIEAEKEV